MASRINVPDVRLTTTDVLRYLDAVEEDRTRAIALAHTLYRDRTDVRLHEYLREHGLRIAFHASDISRAQLTSIEKIYRSETLETLISDPFQCIGRVRGMTYARASGLWRRLGRPGQDNPIAAAAVREIVQQGRERGDVWLDRSAVVHEAQRICGLGPDAVEAALRQFLAAGALTEIKSGTTTRLVRSASLEIEREIATRLRMRQARYGHADRFDVYLAMRGAGILDPDPLQMDAVACALENQVCLITGGPGTGKSTILTAIRILLEQNRPGIRIRLVALAARVARAVGVRTGIVSETIHTTLGMGADGRPIYGPGENLPDDVVILEEAFMIGNGLFAELLAAMKPDARLIIVGDAEQLPPIAEGKPIEAILGSQRVATVRLLTNHRSSSRDIPLAGQRVMQGRPFRASENVRHVAVRRYEDAIAQATQHFTALRSRGETVQILTAMHEGALGTLTLNRAIAGRSDIGVGDTVMQTENDRDRGILNGEIGIVVSHTGTALVVERDDGSTTAYQRHEFRQLVHAWAITYHKAQGLEYDHVILVTSPSQRRMLSRNLINVGITRAKRSCVIVDHQEGLRTAMTIETTNRRTTMLDRLMRGEDIR